MCSSCGTLFFLKSGGMLALQTAELTLMCKTFVMQCADDTSSVFSYPVQGVVLSAELWHRLRRQVHRHWVWRQESNTLRSDFLSPSASSLCHQLPPNWEIHLCVWQLLYCLHIEFCSRCTRHWSAQLSWWIIAVNPVTHFALHITRLDHHTVSTLNETCFTSSLIRILHQA